MLALKTDTLELTTREAIWDTLSPFKNFMHLAFLKKLIAAHDLGIVESLSVSSDTSAKHLRWDGTVWVHLNNQSQLKEIFDYIVTPSHADEISMENNEQTIRLWWD